MKLKTKLKSSHSLIDLTPLVDVVFLLLIFFIVTSDILPLKSLNIVNPQLNKEGVPLTTQLLVVVDAQEVIYVGSKKRIEDLSTLKQALEEELMNLNEGGGDGNQSLVLSFDRGVNYDLFLKVFSIAQECSRHIRLAYQNEKNGVD